MTNPDGIPDFAELERVGSGAGERDEWTLGPLRYRRVAMEQSKPWLCEVLGTRGIAGTGATPYEASNAAVQRLRDHVDKLVAAQQAAEDTLNLMEEM